MTPTSVRGLRRTWPQRLLLAAAAALVAASLTSAWTISELYSSIGDIDRIDLAPGVLAERDEHPDEPRNILLIGSTEIDGIDRDDPLLAGRENERLADTIMVLRLDSRSDEAVVVSINRDLYITEGSYRGRINGAYQAGGAELLIDVVQSVLGVPVHNFVSVNFAGFRQLVDRIDGVPVYFPYPTRDRGAFFEVDAGCHVLDGSEALNYVRGRNFEHFIDGRWRLDRSVDFGRTERQRDFLVLMLDRTISRGGRNPVTMRSLIDAATDGGAVTLDNRLTVGELIDLGTAFAGFDPDNLRRHQLPVVDHITSTGAMVLLLDEARAQPILDELRGIEHVLRPEQVSVRVVDARGDVTESVPADQLIGNRGFALEGPRRTAAEVEATTIAYSPDQRDGALLLARFLSTAPAFDEVAGEGVLTLTLGADYGGVRLLPRDADEVADTMPAPTTNTTTTTAPAGGSPDRAQAAPTTTSDVIGRPPEGVTCR